MSNFDPTSFCVLRFLCYLAIIGAFAYGIYKLYIVPNQATLFDICLVIGSTVIAGVFTLAEQLKIRRERNQRNS